MVHKFVAKLTWQYGVKYTEDHGPQIEPLQTDAAKLWDAQSHKHVICIKRASKYLLSKSKS